MSTALPLIGLTTYVEVASWGYWHDVPAALVPSSYYELVAASGARPLLLPHVADAPGGPAAGANDVMAHLDGLVIIGGLDLDPALYGQLEDPSLGRIDALRDASELAFLNAALETDTPVLAICRGQQVLNVARGGSLLQHIPDTLGTDEHQLATGVFTVHEVATVPGTRTASIFGETPEVACSHHQAIDQLGDGLEVTAWSIEEPGRQPLIEAVELSDARFCLGVQWHPEHLRDARPFDALVAATR